jgi:hypothetical protein
MTDSIIAKNTTQYIEGDISNILINMLSNTIEELILAEDFDFISEHQLIKKIQSPPHDLLTSLALKHTHELFQLHFIIFHILYGLKEKWIKSGVGELLINPLQISIVYSDEPNKTEDNKSINNNNVSGIDKLAEYYLNLNNLTETSAQDIDQLLLGFWKEFYQPTAHNDALTLLNLSPPVIYSDIKKQYKRLASKYHPDKGGSTEKIQQINQAMATLSNIYKAN